MKPVKTIITCKQLALLCIFIIMFITQAEAQCASSVKTISYNIALSGTGNNVWGFSFPQFNPSSGTLIAVNIESLVSVNVKFNLYNLSSAQDNFKVIAGRNDSINVDALSQTISNSFTQTHATYNLQSAQDTVGAGTISSPQFYPLMNSYKIKDSVTGAVAGFLGNNYVSFSYKPETYVSVTSGSSYNLNNIFSDTMKISITYYYCDQNILAEDITNFFVKESGSSVKLSWEIENEKGGRTYQVEESSDGKIFNNTGSLESVVNYEGNGSYTFTTSAGNAPLLYFRIKEMDEDGSYKYSEIKTAEQQNNAGLYLYPNPSNSFINVVFNQPEIKNWDIAIFATDGRLIQKNYFINNNTIHIPFATQLAAGVYFIRAIDHQTQKKYTSSFVVK